MPHSFCAAVYGKRFRLSINPIDGSDLHYGCDGQVSDGRAGSSAFRYLNLLFEGMKYYGAGRYRGKAQRPHR